MDLASDISQKLGSVLEFSLNYGTRLHDLKCTLKPSASIIEVKFKPATLNIQPLERVAVPDLLRLDSNELYRKVTTVLAWLCDEVSELKIMAEADIYPGLGLFGEVQHECIVIAPHVKGYTEGMVGRSLVFFQEASNFIERCNVLTLNIVHQLASLYHSRQKLHHSTFRHVHLIPAFEAIADIFEILITLDAIVASNSTVVPAWGRFKKMLQIARMSPEKFHVSDTHLRCFESMLLILDNTIFAAGAFQSCVDQDFEEIATVGEGSSFIDVRNNNVFVKELFCVLRDQLDRALTEKYMAYDTGSKRIVGYCGIYVLHSRLLTANTAPDIVFFRKLWATQKKVPIVTLFGRAFWFMNEFLLRHAPCPTTKIEPINVPTMRRSFVEKLDASFEDMVHQCIRNVSVWSIEVDSNLCPPPPVNDSNEALCALRETMQHHNDLLSKGCRIASRVKSILTLMLNLHVSEQLPMARKSVRSLSSCLEMLKIIEGAFHRQTVAFAQIAGIMTLVQAREIVSLSRPWRLRLESMRCLDATQVDLLASITNIEHILGSAQTFSFTRRVIAKLGASIFCMKGFLKSDAIAVFERHLWLLDQACDWQCRVSLACDCSALYWHAELLSSTLADVYVEANCAERLQLVVTAFSDAISMLNAVQHFADNNVFIKSYKEYIAHMLNEEIVMPLCREVENALRLHQYSATLDERMDFAFRDKALPKINPEGLHAGLRPLIRFIGLPAIRVLDEILDLRQRVTSYLEREFYQITVLALHDWKAYGEMRNIARKHFGINLADPRLPMGTIDSGLDVLQIMRNIHVFVGLYNYNLNQQCFMERKPVPSCRC